ncbi:MAG: lysophospholipid acyltransferase family protein [Bacillota bacterium]
MKKLKNLLISFIFKLLDYIINFLPLKVVEKIGILIGRLLYLFKVRKKVASSNLLLAFEDDYSLEEIETILKDTYIHFGQVLIEFFLIEKLNNKEFQERITIDNADKLKELINSDQGVIFYTAHFGNWEWLAAIIANYDRECLSIARKQRLADLGDRINLARRNAGVKTTPVSNQGLIKVFKNLKAGNSTMILGDQHASGLPHVMNFFGVPASIHRGAVRLASKTGSLIVPIFIYREGFAKYRVHIHEEVEVPQGTKKAAEPKYLKPLLRVTEEAIKKSPEQWLWFHKRWKVDRGEG